MTDLRLTIDEDFLQELRIHLRSNTKASELIRQALSVYNWAAEERSKGRLIISSDPSGTDLAALRYEPLENAAPPATVRAAPDDGRSNGTTGPSNKPANVT